MKMFKAIRRKDSKEFVIFHIGLVFTGEIPVLMSTFDNRTIAEIFNVNMDKGQDVNIDDYEFVDVEVNVCNDFNEKKT